MMVRDMQRFLTDLQVEQVKKSRVMAFPTDTVPGLFARPDDIAAIEKILTLKQRPPQKSLMLMLPSLTWVHDYFQISKEDWSIISRNSPGKITFVLPMKAGAAVSPHVCQQFAGKNYVGFRCPDHPIAQEILNIVGPLAQTSLNVSGALPVQNSDEISFKEKIDFIFPFQNHPQLPSTIIRLHQGAVEYLRHGIGKLL